MPDMGKNKKQKLTTKQRKFAELIASGTMNNLSDTYRAVYDTTSGPMSNASIRVEASRLAANPNVTLLVEQLTERKVRAELAVGLSDRDRVLTKLRTLLDDGEPSDAVKVAAARLLGQSCGLFTTDISITNTNKDADTIEAELIAKLESLGISDKVQDITPNVDISEDASVH